MAETEAAPMGDNKPPPAETWGLHINDLYAEAEQWLDGEPVSTAQQAEDIGKLLRMLAEARKGADAARAEEKAPHLEAGRKVDAAFKPLLEKCDKAVRVAKQALTPWLEAVEAENRRKAAEAARIAREAEEKARAAHIESRKSADVRDLDRIEELDREAEEAKKAAARAAKKGAAVDTGGLGNRVTLRTKRYPVVVDRRELLKHYLANKPDVVEGWLLAEAEKDVRAGATHVPGCKIEEERIAA